ncbi:hypothetical protein BKK79_03625 [Cupriavidus sp. USMAA2-4]|uniref:AAA family ATPase n=1 Tax=Cupriavidus sp. USMAA2-4 TaxID=876364 RepID=UPI0008A69353|nr:AAA family ATPase [Cupriavidus sp. USMAA2-4]AOY91003.1 hypothetical protein BKK79_03625 [Cupriavidus sp. USMAA2-4]
MNPLHHYRLSYLLDGEIAFLRGTAPGCEPVLLAVAGAAADAGAVQRRFEHEYSLQAVLRPQWAVVPAALTRFDGRPALVAADAGGMPLALSMGGPLPVQDCLDIAIAVTEALAAMHDAGLVHLDIKPAHLLVAPDRQRAWLTGFGIAGAAATIRTRPAAPMLAGTLAYMAPERAGRGGMPVDARADLYALGVVFYQMLTGVLPLEADEPVGWVHSHLARQPLAPAERQAGVPWELSAIVMRLLAKAPAERHAGAHALLADLRACRNAWRSGSGLPACAEADGDTAAPAGLYGLYGRGRELEALRRLQHAAMAPGVPAPALSTVLVTGRAGIGKSALIGAFCRAQEAAGGVVARAKAHPQRGGTPLAAVAEICADLARQSCDSAQARRQGWAAAMAAALGDDLGAFSEVVPAFAAWLPPQAGREPRAGLTAARFAQRLRRLLAVFGTVAPPLTVVLDDLQWMDAGSLEVFAALARRGPAQPLLVICSCRSEALGDPVPGHWLAELRAQGGLRGELALDALDGAALSALVAGTLGCGSDRAQAIARLVARRTGGNPLFFLRYLYALQRAELLPAEGGGVPEGEVPGGFDADAAQADLPALLGRELRQLPQPARTWLGALSCLGGSVSPMAARLAWQAAQAAGEAAQDGAALEAVAAPALAAGLLVPAGDGFLFSHDRVQEAAYAALEASGRSLMHLRLARLLAREPADKLFAAADQFRRGGAAITDEAERIAAARLILEAGARALRTTDYRSASAYFAAGERFLPAQPWEREPALALALAQGRAESEFASGQPAVAAAILEPLAGRAPDVSSLAEITRLRVAVHTALDQADRAAEIGLEFVAGAGLVFLPGADWQVEQAYRRFLQLLGGRPLEALARLPRMQDATWRATMSVLTEMMSPASCLDANLRDLIPAWMASISLSHGNDEASCMAYVHLGMAFGPRLGDYPSGYRLGRLGVELAEREGTGRMRAKARMHFGAFLLPWTQPLQGGRELIEHSFDEARRSGDVNLAGDSRHRLVTQLLSGAEPLADVEAKVNAGLAFGHAQRLGRVNDILGAQSRYIAVLRGRAPCWTAPLPGEPAPQAIEARLGADRRLAVAACCYWVRKLQACFALDDWRGALEAVERAEPWLWTVSGFLEAADYHFFSALALAWAPPEGGRAASDADSGRMAAMARHREPIEAWARQSPVNFGARAALLTAEATRLGGDVLQAMRGYEQAARLAREQDLLHEEALAYELCARCCFGQALSTVGLAYLRRAVDAYGRWGAQGQVAKLEALLRALDNTASGLASAAHDSVPGAAELPATYIGPAAQLDLDTAIRATQVLAGEMRRERLIEALLTTTLEHAAAQRGLLFLWQGGSLRLAALATTQPAGISVELDPGEASGEVPYPRTIVAAALAVRADLILDNAKAHARYGQDPDVRARSVRSVACLALVKQGELVGLLYLENNLADGLFGGRRISLLPMLASQAAISLENARLYDELLRENQERERVQAELAHASRVATLGELAASIAHEVNQPLTGIVTYGGACLRWLDRPQPELGEARQAVESMIAEGLRASEVIRRIRALARKDEVRRQPFALGELVGETLAMVRHQAESHGIAIVRHEAPGLPDVAGDRIQVQQVIINLLVNAIQSMASCPGRAHELLVCLARHEDDGKVRLRVEDSGPGIEADQIGKLFGAFYTTRKEGLGMGLSICRSILAAHGGSIWAESPARPDGMPGPGGGAAFSFTLPAWQPDA